MINRPEYLDTLIRWKNHDDMIKVVTGVRRCGKSTLFLLFQDYLKKNGVSEKQILGINLELAENAKFLDWRVLYDYVKEQALTDKMNYVFLDEIQMVPQYQRAVNGLRLRKNIDVYVTGSNAYMFSQKLTTLLSGRYIEIQMLPLSFKEYMSAFPGADENSPDKQFNDYVTRGSFPQTLNFYNAENEFDQLMWNNYMDSLYNTIIVKDIMARQGIQEISKLNRVIKFMFGNIGSETSLTNISNVINNDLKLKPAESKIHVQTIEKYLDALLDGYVFYKASPAYLKGKAMLRSNAKYYASDAGLRYFLLGGGLREDAGHILENIVYLELKRRGYNLQFGKVGGEEVDFVAAQPGGRVEYYQVAQSVLSEETLNRELAPLQAIKDNYPKYLLTRDYNNTNYQGIRHINVLQWLLRRTD